MPKPPKPPITPDDPVPEPTKDNIDACERCDLYRKATQGVGGEGAGGTGIMLVGEQPGDEEDLQGRPFVGPAGKLLRKALDEAGLDASSVFITNAVKHFSFEPRGVRRIHKTPAQRQIDACRAWLEREIARLKPIVIVALGATALNGVMGGKMKVSEAREAKLTHASGARVLASFHPSAALRIPDKEARAALYQTIVNDLRKAAQLAGKPKR
jgi:DNA polymerase